MNKFNPTEIIDSLEEAVTQLYDPEHQLPPNNDEPFDLRYPDGITNAKARATNIRMIRDCKEPLYLTWEQVQSQLENRTNLVQKIKRVALHISGIIKT